ncbi:MAG: multidrug efflux MFS transporter [Chloroflexi bacterium]|nr:multidrug efflux MFS transporter [Chloroflexota bacterium]
MEADSLTPGWQRNLYVIWVAELVAIAGFSVALPFLPYYVQELGVTDPEQVAMWSGLVFSGHAITMAIFAPLWGSLADRYGRKLMVVRAMFGGAVLLGAMGLVRNVQQLALLRALQGCVTGTIPAATTLVASSVPRQRSGYALGLLQMAIYSGASVGPLLGGLVADALGYRAAFWVTAALLFTAGLSVFLLVEERFEPSRRKEDSPAKGLGQSASAETSASGFAEFSVQAPVEGFWQGWALVLRSRALLVILGTQVVMRFGSRIMGPMLPLFVQSLMPDGERVASVTGLITGVGAATAALGAVALGRIGDRIGYRRVLVTCALSAAALYAPQFFASTPTQLLILQGAVGVALGGILASVSATLARLAPEGRQGVVYGMDASAVSLANAVAPMAGAAIATALGLRFIFLCTAGIFALAALGLAGSLASAKEAKQ